MEIVVNEWLLDYLCPDTEEYKKELVIKFVNAWEQGRYGVVIRRPSPFLKKFYQYWQRFGRDTDIKKRFLKLSLLFYDSDKTIIADERDIRKLPEELEAKTPSDDKYLIELCYSKSGRIIITTDTPLKQKLEDEPDLKIYLLEEFLQEYLSQS